MVPTKKVDKTPYEIWHGQAPRLSYLKVWGCEAFVKRDTLTKPDKLDPRSFKSIFVGYPKETMGYSFYSPSENKVFVARNAEFFESKLLDLKASGSVEDLELIQEEDTNPSVDTGLDHEEDDQEIDEPQSDINPIRKSSKTRRAPDRMCLYIDAEEHELGDLDEPANYKAALLDLESKKWLDAMNVEMQSMKDNDVWVLVELPPNARTIGSKWLFKKKTDMDGAVYIFKARLVAKGFTQTYGLKLSKSQGASTPAEIQRLQNIPYALAVGSIIEIALVNEYEIEVRLVGPTLKMYKEPMRLVIWNMTNTRNLVLKTNWYRFVEDNKEHLKELSKIQLWSFRKDQQLCSAIAVVARPPEGLNSVAN
nr:retrotransposon protein, putative, Ty1-copia subclass [Tanacetum cinerariifolium]